MGRLTEVVKSLLIINGIVFVAFFFLMDHLAPMTHLYYPGYEYRDVGVMFQPYQIVSHMFMHGSVMHIIFNLMTLAFLGPPVEATVGPKRFLIIYFVSGMCSAGLHMLLAFLGVEDQWISIVGASGAISGVVAAFAVLYPNNELMMMFIPFPIKAKYFVGGFAVLSLIFGVFDLVPGIAHFAHLGGAIGGFILSWYWYRRTPNISG